MLRLLNRLFFYLSFAFCTLFATPNLENLDKNLDSKNAQILAFKGENVIKNFIKQSYEKNENFSLVSIKMDKIYRLKNGFEARILSLKLKFKPLNKIIKKSEVIFVKDNIFTTDIINIKDKTSLRDEIFGEKMSVSYERLRDENTKDCD